MPMVAPTRDQYLAMESQRWSAHRDRAFTVELTGADLEILCGAMQLINSVEGERLFQFPPGGPGDGSWQFTPELVELRRLLTLRGGLLKKLIALAT